MKNSSIILILGGIVIVGGGLYWFRKVSRKKAAEIEAANLAAKSEGEQRTAMTNNLVAWSKTLADRKDFSADEQTKFNNTLTSNIMSLSELKALNDAYLVDQKKYVGTAKEAEINGKGNNVLLKYNIIQKNTVELNPLTAGVETLASNVV